MIWSFHSVVDIDYSLLGKYTWLKNKFCRELDALCSEKSGLGGNYRRPVGREALCRACWRQGKVEGCLFGSIKVRTKQLIQLILLVVICWLCSGSVVCLALFSQNFWFCNLWHYWKYTSCSMFSVWGTDRIFLMSNTGHVQLVEYLAWPIFLKGYFIKFQTVALLCLIREWQLEGIREWQLEGDEQNLLCKILLILHVISVKMFVTQGC